MSHSDRSASRSRPPRTLVAQLLSFVALLAAVVGAVGPAQHISTTYSWPPSEPPTGTTNRTWYTPLLLIGRNPHEVTATLPCVLPPALSKPSRRVVVFATARFPERNGGLAILRRDRELVVQVGGRVLTKVSSMVASDANANEGCEYRLNVVDDRWSLAGGPGRLERQGDLPVMPVINGLFSSLDLRSGITPSIDINTKVHAAKTSVRQAIAWTVAVLLAVTALLLVSIENRPRRLAERVTSAARAAARAARPADGVVGLALLGWWLIGPVFWDDGWMIASLRTFSSSGGFSTYYDALGANHVLGYWLEWIQHSILGERAALLVLRVPSILCLAAIWVVSRWVLARALMTSPRGDQVPMWALTGAFLALALAWGATLRQEPQIALLITGVMACTVRFLERNSAAPLALATVLAALAVSIHPNGIVAIGPLLVAMPSVSRWARSHVAVVASIVTASAALLVVLLFVGSDLELRRMDALTFQNYGGAADARTGWREEVSRYAELLTPQYGTPLRRASVALMGLAGLAFVLRSRRVRRLLLDLPATALTVILFLLIATPSRWPWHFGALIGIGAVAVATETARLREDGLRSRGWSARPFIVLGAAIVATAWSWSPRHEWNDLDLRTMEWVLGIERVPFTLSTLALLVPIALLGGLGMAEILRGSRGSLPKVPWRVASWTAPILAIPLIAFTAGVLVTDAAKSDASTLPRESINTLQGEDSCGLADDTVVAVPASMRPLRASTALSTTSKPPRWVPGPPASGLPSFALGPAPPGSRARTPWFELPAGRPIGLFIAGTAGLSGRVELEWGRREGARVENVRRDNLRDVSRAEVHPRVLTWRFFPAAELAERPHRANLVRIALWTDVHSGATIATTAPVTYKNERLAQRFERGDSKSLVTPPVLTYVPCAELPALHNGIVDPPAQILALRTLVFPLFGSGASPFDGLLDLYRINRLPLADSRYPPGDIVLYHVDQQIPRAREVAPDSITVTS